MKEDNERTAVVGLVDEDASGCLGGSRERQIINSG